MCLLWSSVDGWKCVRFLLLFHPLVPVTESPKSSFLNILLVLCVISVLCGASYYLYLLAVHGTICVFWWCTALSVCSGGAQHYLCLLVVHGTICVFWWCMALSVSSGGAQHYLCLLVVHGTICVFWWCTALSVCSGVHSTICVLDNDCVFWGCTALSVSSGGAQHYLCVLGVHGTICVLDNDCVFWGCTALSVCLTMITFTVSNKNCNMQLLVIEETE